jgi:hypothetical protein
LVADHSKFVRTFGDVASPRAQALAETLARLRPATGHNAQGQRKSLAGQGA